VASKATRLAVRWLCVVGLFVGIVPALMIESPASASTRVPLWTAGGCGGTVYIEGYIVGTGGDKRLEWIGIWPDGATAALFDAGQMVQEATVPNGIHVYRHLLEYSVVSFNVRVPGVGWCAYDLNPCGRPPAYTGYWHCTSNPYEEAYVIPDGFLGIDLPFLVRQTP
jgi:hypothetical protein